MPNLGTDGGEPEVNKADPFLYMQTWPYRRDTDFKHFPCGISVECGELVLFPCYQPR